MKSMECPSWPESLSNTDRERAVQELIEGRGFATQLQVLVQNHKPLGVGDRGMVEAEILLANVLGSFRNVLLILKSGECTREMYPSPMTSITTQGSNSSAFSDEMKILHSTDKRKTPVAARDCRGGYKRRKASDTWDKITPTPAEDAYAWRKYGQKGILNSRYPRNYFRCRHKTDQGCQATKHVQKTDEDPPMYQTTYVGKHTCTGTLKPIQLIPTSNTIFKTNQDFDSVLPTHGQLPNTLNRSSSLDQYTMSPELSAFEPSGPRTILASSTGSDHGDVISGVYSCITSSESLDLDLVLGSINFEDFFADEGLL